jgi:hypothetical protein
MERGRRRAALELGAAAIVVSSALVALSPAGAATTSSILSGAKAAIATQTSVHLYVYSESGSASSTVVVDLGTKSGVETIREGKESVTIEVTPTYAYMSGTSSGLTSIIGLTAAQAKKIGKDWMSMKAGTTPYSDLKSTTTMSTLANLLPKAKGISLSLTDVKGTKLYVLSWTAAATSSTPKTVNTFSFSAVGAPLPVEEVSTGSTGSGTTQFSRWGEQVVVNVPPAASTITYSKVVG